MREADSFQLQMEGVFSQQVGAQSVEGGGSSRDPPLLGQFWREALFLPLKLEAKVTVRKQCAHI